MVVSDFVTEICICEIGAVAHACYVDILCVFAILRHGWQVKLEEISLAKLYEDFFDLDRSGRKPRRKSIWSGTKSAFKQLKVGLRFTKTRNTHSKTH